MLVALGTVNLYLQFVPSSQNCGSFMSQLQFGHRVVNFFHLVFSTWTKGPSLCLMTALLLFGLLWLFSFVSAFSHFSDYSFSTDKRQAEDMGWGGARTIRFTTCVQSTWICWSLCTLKSTPLDCDCHKSDWHPLICAVNIPCYARVIWKSALGHGCYFRDHQTSSDVWCQTRSRVI